MGAPWAGLGPVGWGGAVGTQASCPAVFEQQGEGAGGGGVGGEGGGGGDGRGRLVPRDTAPSPGRGRGPPGTAPALARPGSPARRRPASTASIRARPGRAGTRWLRPGARGAPASPRMLRGQAAGGLFIAPGHHVGGVAGDPRATRLVVAPTPAA